jgi:pimeloyl-ACP methyl ester carboxylesterase
MRLRAVSAFGVVFAVLAAAATAFGQRTVTFPLGDHSAEVQGDLYGSGTRGIVLAHGGRFNKESWKKQAEVFAASGFEVLAVRFRGDRLNADGSPSAEGSDAENADDVMAAVAYLHSVGVKTVYAVGGSLGGAAVGDADAMSAPGSIERMVFLGSDGGDEPEKLSGRKLFIVARDDRSGEGLRLPGIEAHYKQAPEPKKLVIVEGSAHAQYLFDTDEGPRVMKEILEFFAEP